LLGVGLVKKF